MHGGSFEITLTVPLNQINLGTSLKSKKVGKTEKPEDDIYEFDEEEGEDENETERTSISDLLIDIESKCPNYQRLLHVYVEKGEDAIVKVQGGPLLISIL